MENVHLPKLNIDAEFKDLISPLQRQEYLQLEENILMDGCRDPLIVWNNTIIDGHNRYEICCRHNIPFAIVEKQFSSKEEAIAWICANQLGRRNISEETRKFLIGKQYDARRLSSLRKAQSTGQLSDVSHRAAAEQFARQQDSRHTTAELIAAENNISPGTVQKYAIYSRSIDAIGRKTPSFSDKILSGQYKISHNNVVELAKKTPRELQRIEKKIDAMNGPFIQYKNIRPAISGPKRSNNRVNRSGPSVKDMPAFDPDAAITGLYLTIPSWTETIGQAISNGILNGTSEKAQHNLKTALSNLITRASDLLREIEGK